jgi:glycosyltransferase involved in cell wall biosynthesis
MAKPAFRYRDRNPYCALLYEQVRHLDVRVVEFSLLALLLGQFDILHLHWPQADVSEPSVAVSGIRWLGLVAVLGWARLLGKKIVWTVHDLQPHELRHPRLLRSFRRVFLASLSGYFALSDSSRRLAEATHPALRRVRAFVTPHGHYRGEYPDSLSAAAARAALGLSPSQRVFLHLGQIRPYKNVPALIRLFRQTSAPDDVLLVTGSCADPALRREVESAAAGDPRVRTILRFVPAEQVQTYLRAADLVVLPYVHILNSGSLLLALSFDRPVLAPAQGSIPELAQVVGPPWVMIYPGELDAPVLQAAMDRARQIDPAQIEALHQRLEAFSWPAIAERTAAAYRELVAASPAART